MSLGAFEKAYCVGRFLKSRKWCIFANWWADRIKNIMLSKVISLNLPICCCFISFAQAKSSLLLSVTIWVINWRSRYAVRQEIFMADEVKYKVLLRVFLSLAFLHLGKKLLWYQRVWKRFIFDVMINTILLESWTLLAERNDLSDRLCTLLIKAVHHWDLVVDIRNASTVDYLYASFMELIGLALQIDITTGQLLHACLIVWTALTHVIACAFFL